MSAENQNAGAQSTASGAGKPGADHAAAPSGSRAGRGTATGHVAPSGQLSESQHITRSYVRVVKVFRRHDTRHTTGTRHLRVTGNLKATQKLLGHSRIERPHATPTCLWTMSEMGWRLWTAPMLSGEQSRN
jgi:integrase